MSSSTAVQQLAALNAAARGTGALSLEQLPRDALERILRCLGHDSSDLHSACEASLRLRRAAHACGLYASFGMLPGDALERILRCVGPDLRAAMIASPELRRIALTRGLSWRVTLVNRECLHHCSGLRFLSSACHASCQFDVILEAAYVLG